MKVVITAFTPLIFFNAFLILPVKNTIDKTDSTKLRVWNFYTVASNT